MCSGKSDVSTVLYSVCQCTQFAISPQCPDSEPCQLEPGQLPVCPSGNVTGPGCVREIFGSIQSISSKRL